MATVVVMERTALRYLSGAALDWAIANCAGRTLTDLHHFAGTDNLEVLLDIAAMHYNNEWDHENAIA